MPYEHSHTAFTIVSIRKGGSHCRIDWLCVTGQSGSQSPDEVAQFGRRMHFEVLDTVPKKMMNDIPHNTIGEILDTDYHIQGSLNLLEFHAGNNLDQCD